MQSIWIQRPALLQISNMTLGTSINLLHLSSLAVKWKESYYFFLARLLVFSAGPVSVFRAVSWHKHLYKFSRGHEVKRCAGSQVEGGSWQGLEALPGPCPSCTCVWAVSGMSPACPCPAQRCWSPCCPLTCPPQQPCIREAAPMTSKPHLKHRTDF